MKRRTTSKSKSKKTTRKTTAKKSAKRKAGKSGVSAFMAALKPSPALAHVVGQNPLPRTQVVKKMWSYIKRKGLQDKKNKRMINTDETLKYVFANRDQISMFEMNKLLKKHLTSA